MALTFLTHKTKQGQKGIVSNPKLWVDIPAEQRLDKAFLLQHFKYSQWVQGLLDDIAYPKCAAAVLWGSWLTTTDRDGHEEKVPPRYKPCARKPLNGAAFCYVHGGPLKPIPSLLVPDPKQSMYSVRVVERAYRHFHMQVLAKSKNDALQKVLRTPLPPKKWSQWEDHEVYGTQVFLMEKKTAKK